MPDGTVMLRTAIGSRIEVDREGGVIRGVTVISAGTTLPDAAAGRIMLVDQTTLQQVADAINASEIGVKSRLTHPELTGADDIQFRLGYIRNARLAEGRVVADMHFHNPASDEAIRLMDIADQDPGSAGLSVSSETPTLEPTGDDAPALRLAEVDAVDWVGAPASNPTGLLSAKPKHINLQEGSPMFTQAQIEYLVGLGMDENANAEQINEFVAGLDPEQKAALDKLAETGEGEGETAENPEAAAMEDGEREEEKPAAMAEDDDEKEEGMAASAQGSVDTNKAVQLAMKRERERCREARRIALKCGLGETWAEKQIDKGTDVAEMRRVALEQMNREPSKMPTTRVQVGADLNRDSLDEAVRDAILLRANPRQRFAQFDQDGRVSLSADGSPQLRQPHERARQFRGHSIIEMGRRYLMALGYHQADNMGKTELATLLMSRPKLQSTLGSVYLAHATGDFPELLADAMGKQLRQQYALAPTTWQLWARQVTAPDFKDQKRLQLSEAGDLREVPEGDEYDYVGLTESKQTWKLKKYGLGLKFTREMLINDDLDAFDRGPQILARTAARKVETLAIGVLTDNQLADGTTLFSGGNSNTVTGVINRTNLGNAKAKLRRQTALGSDDPLELMPRFLLVPESISTDAETFISSSQVLETGGADPATEFGTANPFANRLQVIPSARLDTDSTTQWYLMASPDEIDTVEIGFLEGEETPVLEEEDEFDSDVRKLKIRHQIAAAAIDYRGLVRSSGS